MAGLEESLRRVLDVGGARTAALVDVGTGMVVAAAGEEPDGLPAAAASLADEARLAGADDDLQEILLTTPTRLHLVEFLSAGPGDGLVLFVDLDRSRTNAALAVAQVTRAASALLA